ncbi:nuclear transport factor 2 family protein [Chryseobacterium sp. MEBOG06]|uniref:nuclear transport factor 2 family protein n=1 Tax=unclassified Chryseobacterium TaxID=2593645 RepID=UPI001F3D1C37|nr:MULTISPECIES: nuclear transport factor 2 family protein [unclassified Chryseobacterium]UKB85763.1 nuclear transport factor 2 family protein [Chryseobacterium sp. MEBOG06]
MNYDQKILEAEDRLAIRELVDRYAYCADTRDAKGQMALFTNDTNFEVYYDPKADSPSEVYTGRPSLFPVFDNLNSYSATMHFNGQSTILSLNENTATGITYCIAHHQTFENNIQKLMVAYIRYKDRFVKQDEKWFFAERKLLVDIIENR